MHQAMTAPVATRRPPIAQRGTVETFRVPAAEPGDIGAPAVTVTARATSERTALPTAERFVLHLYVTGASRVSQQAVVTLSSLCEQRLAGHYTLEVIDVHHRQCLAVAEQVRVTPTLVRVAPLPLVHLVGDLADQERVAALLGLPGPVPAVVDLTCPPVPSAESQHGLGDG